MDTASSKADILVPAITAGEIVVALFDYQSTEPGDLSFKVISCFLLSLGYAAADNDNECRVVRRSKCSRVMTQDGGEGGWGRTSAFSHVIMSESVSKPLRLRKVEISLITLLLMTANRVLHAQLQN